MFEIYLAICFTIAGLAFALSVLTFVIYLILLGIASSIFFCLLALPGAIVKWAYDGLRSIGCNAGKNRRK